MPVPFDRRRLLRPGWTVDARRKGLQQYRFLPELYPCLEYEPASGSVWFHWREVCGIPEILRRSLDDSSGFMRFRPQPAGGHATATAIFAAADGQMGTSIMRVYREWQLSEATMSSTRSIPKVERRRFRFALDTQGLGCQPGWRDGRMPAQYDGRIRILADPEIGFLVPRRR